MTLDQAKQILEICFKREHRAYAVWQRAKTKPTESDLIKILQDSDYVSNLEWKQKSIFADCKYWEDRIKDGSYKTHPIEDNIKFYGLKEIA